MPVPGRGHNTIEIIEVVSIIPLSFFLVCLVRTLELFDVLSKAFEYTTLYLIFCDANKVFSFLKEQMCYYILEICGATISENCEEKKSYLDCVIDSPRTFF